MSAKFATHLFSYRFGDARWSLEIQATSAEEAKERMKALAWATYDGELVANIPLAPRRFVRFFDWLRRAAPNH
jgi:hypothetical protein